MTSAYKEIEHEVTDSIVCPWCGEVEQASWEYGLSDGDSEKIECDNCDKNFIVYASIDISYSTEKMGDDNETKRLD